MQHQCGVQEKRAQRCAIGVAARARRTGFRRTPLMLEELVAMADLETAKDENSSEQVTQRIDDACHEVRTLSFSRLRAYRSTFCLARGNDGVVAG
jgi:hypothetical protein